MKAFLYAAGICILLLGCSVNEFNVAGNYKSNHEHILKLNADKSFTMEYIITDTLSGKKMPVKVTGNWKLKEQAVSLEVDDKTYKYWECLDLAAARTMLRRPVKCGSDREFIFFKRSR